MPFELECTGGAMPGKRFPISEGKSKVFRVFRAGQEAGTVEIELHDGQGVITNRSPRQVLVNGIERARFVLVNGDMVAIGKDTFLVHCDDRDEGMATQMMPGNTSYAPQPQGHGCTVCGAAVDPQTGWSNGELGLCANCIAKGHTPRSLAEEGPALAPRRPSPLPMAEPRRPSPAPAEPVAEDVSGLPEHKAETAPYQAPGVAAAAGAANRQRKQISASQSSSVPAGGNGSLLKKVQSVFSGRADRQHLDELQREREVLLMESGRHALLGDLFGLPESALAAILAGRQVTIAPGEVSRPTLEGWRAARDRLSLLDAEISALRKNLGLGPDLQSMPGGGMVLRDQDKAREDRTFAALDGMQTESLEVELPSSEPAPASAKPAAQQAEQPKAVSQRRPIPPRRIR
jgi:hypothetical protein